MNDASGPRQACMNDPVRDYPCHRPTPVFASQGSFAPFRRDVETEDYFSRPCAELGSTASSMAFRGIKAARAHSLRQGHWSTQGNAAP